MESVAQLRTGGLVLADDLRNDILCAFQCVVYILNVPFDESLGCRPDISFPLNHDKRGQRLQSLLAGYLCFRVVFRLERHVDVLKGRAVPAAVDAYLQFCGQFAQFIDGIQNGFLSLGQFLQLVISVADALHLHLVEGAGALFAISADERNGTAFIEQG